LDKGELDGSHDHEGEAKAEILRQLAGFPVHGWNEERNEWWAKRTAAADIQMRFRVEPRIATPRRDG
jgi:hypothetical protein